MKTEKTSKKKTRISTAEIWGDIEVYTYKNQRIEEPSVTFTGRGLITFNKPMLEEVGKEYNHLMLGYSKRHEAIIFLFLKEGTGNSYKIAKSRSTYSMTFFKHFKINLNKYQRKYEPVQKKIPKIGERWVIYLKKKAEGETE